MIKCIAIDDEPKALEIIQSHLSKLDSITLMKSFNDPIQAISYLTEHDVDLLFLDINMPNINGMELLKAIPNQPLVIFTTAHSEYAVESYEYKALDYLLKPFDFPRFMQAVNKVIAKLKDGSSSNNDFVFINTGNQKQRLSFDDIYYVEADGNYVSYVTKQGKLLVRSSVKDALSLLPNKDFIQIHRSHIVAISKIEKIEDNHVVITGQRISISGSFRERFITIVNSLNE